LDITFCDTQFQNKNISQTDGQLIIPDEVIMSKILLIRGAKVMVDSDSALLYGVPTKRLNEQVKRNLQSTITKY
jgi:hypothetical protein